ncbi:hypothetical protein LXL04_010492 [Taraxacum kok-saghyz]
MAKTRSMTRSQSHDKDDNDAPWSDLTNDVLYLVMMTLGVIDFVSFSGVCKSWRSLALCNRKKFMTSRPPMLMQIHNRACKEKWCCYLEDFEGRKFKTLISESNDTRNYVGLTCGYLVFWVVKTNHNHFWLINPITRRQLYSPRVPSCQSCEMISYPKAILVFSPFVRGWVFVMIDRHLGQIWYSIAGKTAWNHVHSNSYFRDIHAFKGKIYAQSSLGRLYEMSLPNHKLSKLEIGDFGEQRCIRRYEFVNFGENLYVSNRDYTDHILYGLDSGKMKPVSLEEKKKLGEYVVFLRYWKHAVAIKPESWAVDPRSKYKAYDCFRYTKDAGRFFSTEMWYFPHCFVDVDPINK